MLKRKFALDLSHSHLVELTGGGADGFVHVILAERSDLSINNHGVFLDCGDGTDGLQREGNKCNDIIDCVVSECVTLGGNNYEGEIYGTVKRQASAGVQHYIPVIMATDVVDGEKIMRDDALNRGSGEIRWAESQWPDELKLEVVNVGIRHSRPDYAIEDIDIVQSICTIMRKLTGEEIY